MNVNERIRYLRKSELEMTQDDFASKIDISRSNLGNIETGRIIVTDRVISSICREFNISEDWLRYGKEPMKVQPPVFSLDDFVKSKGATDLELEIVKAYFDIEPDTRKMLVEHFKNRLSAYSGNKLENLIPSGPEEMEAKYPPVSADESEAE